MTAAGLVIFDCDGVLIDSETIAARVHAEALQALGYAYTTDDMRRFVGVSGRDMCRIIEEESGRPLPEDYYQVSQGVTQGRFGGARFVIHGCGQRG
jgi:beta-phosphoglucomutase-like phosphatase (HAD superfamily)